MSSALMPAPSLVLPALPSRAWLRNAGAAVVAVGLHGLVLGLLLSQWPSDRPEPPQVRTLTTRLISLAPPAPPVPPQPEVVAAPPVPLEPVKPVKPVEAPKPDPRLQQQKLEQAALARKRVEEQKREEQRQEQQRIEQQRLEQLRREAEAQAQQQRLAEQQTQAAERARQAEAAAAASRQYLPIAKDAPDYPERALDKGIQGDCTVSYRVNPQGRVENPQVVGDCHPLFIRPSLSAAKSFRYQPRIVDGQAVAVEGVKNTFHYRIE
ncbi:energy transducer TonB [Aquipseudomonas guryensis]|uniref:Protein TonB n=1 Tax=Aquipseudomonas guryensis TaxID=2759165 RepID=A0A7W4DAI8_9GAMM|nr:energy transducer TonB [Pseudomonas guryensis]MBB1519017.1 TonB family protein [Pseudomonas guryensis]